MSFVREFGKLFVKKVWCIGYRYNDSEELSIFYKNPYIVILPTLNEWYADPFPFVYKGKKYIFAEIMRDGTNHIGSIGVKCLDDELGFRIIIQEPFHMSYPNVFQYKKDFYMIPETHQANKIILYKAVEFPYKWERDCTLIDGIKAVDTSLVSFDSKFYIITHDLEHKKNYYIELDLDNKTAKLLDIGTVISDDRRPGGNIVSSNSGSFHTLQDCDRIYGKYLHVYEVEKANKESLLEREIAQYSMKDIITNVKKKFWRVHTYNKTDELETIDLLYYQLNPTLIFKAIYYRLILGRKYI